jgi:hypothetical protein
MQSSRKHEISVSHSSHYEEYCHLGSPCSTVNIYWLLEEYTGSSTLLPWSPRQYVPSNIRRVFTRLHNVTFHKTVLHQKVYHVHTIWCHGSASHKNQQDPAPVTVVRSWARITQFRLTSFRSVFLIDKVLIIRPNTTYRSSTVVFYCTLQTVLAV